MTLEEINLIENKFTKIAEQVFDKKFEEREKIVTIARTDLNELKDIVRGLALDQSTTKIEINDLKGIVKELAEAQKRTEIKIEELAEAQKRTEIKIEELAEAQKRTEIKVEELAEAQKRTEIKIEELAQAQKKTEEELQKLIVKVSGMSDTLDNTNKHLGGLSKSVSYSLENEAFRVLPAYLKEKYGIDVIDKFVRKDIEGEEINIFARAKKDDKELFIVGETVLKLDSVSEITQLKTKAQVIENKYNKEVIKILITHYAKQFILEKANKDGIIIIQSFEW